MTNGDLSIDIQKQILYGNKDININIDFYNDSEKVSINRPFMV